MRKTLLRTRVYIFIIFVALIACVGLYLRSEGFQGAPSDLKQYNVIFAGTVRNVEKYIQKSLTHIEKCGKKFNDYAVIIYENDSADSTRQILEENKKVNYHYIFENDIKEPMRAVRIANGRNKILDKMREINEGNYYDYLIVLDLDDINESGRFIDSIETCFKHSGWDVLTGNQTGRYYDLWALRKKGDMEYDCWEMVSKNSSDPNATYKYVESKFKTYPPGELLEVDSAFGGAAIYKISSIPESCRYFGMDAARIERCEHVGFHKCLKDHGKTIHINTSFLTS
jgi:hypothetical protein